MDNVDRADLRRVMDGRWADVRERVRRTVPPDWCEPAGDLPRAEHRTRTTARARELAATGLPRLGFEKAYGGDDDIGGSLTFFEMLGLVDLSLMVKAGVQWGLFGGAIQALGTERHHERTCRDDDARAARLLRDDRDGPRLRRAVTADHGDLRPGHRGVRRHTPRTTPPARTTSATPPATAGSPWCLRSWSPAARTTACTPSLSRSATSKATRARACGSRTAATRAGSTVSTTGGCGSTTSACRATTCSTATAGVAADGTYSSPIENRTQRFFTMLGALVRGRISVGGGAGQRAPAWPSPSRSGTAEVRTPVRPPRRRRGRRCSTTSPISAGCSRRSRRRTHCTSPRAQLVSDAHDIQTGGTTDEAAPARARVARGRYQGRQHLARDRDDPDLPGGLRRGRLPLGEPAARAQGRHRRLHDLRGRQHGVAAARGAGRFSTRYRDHFGDLDAMGTRPVPGRSGQGDRAREDLGARSRRPPRCRGAGSR